MRAAKAAGQAVLAGAMLVPGRDWVVAGKLGESAERMRAKGAWVIRVACADRFIKSDPTTDKRTCLMRILLLFLFLLPFSASSQTREETEKWILSKVDVRSLELGLEYSIVDGELIRVVRPISVLSGDSRFDHVHETSIPLGSIKTISYKHTDEYLSFELKCNDDCVYYVLTSSREEMKKDEYIGVFRLEVYAKVDAEMAVRMQNALLHLVQLHGGSAKIVPFPEPKEAF